MAITYKIQRSSRRKSIGIKIEAYTGNVTVFAPKLTPLSRIEEVVKRREAWIIEKVNAIKAKNSILPKIESGARLYIAGNHYFLNLAEVKRSSIKGEVITLPKENAKRSLVDLTKRLFLPYIVQKTNYFAKAYGFKYESVSLNKAKRKWGSCTSTGKITYSVALAYLPEGICDYVVLHELCHTKEMNHQKGFYALLSKFMPDYKTRQKYLKIYGSYLSYFYEE